MGSVLDFSEKLYKSILDPFGTATGSNAAENFQGTPTLPAIGKAPELDEAETRNAAEAAAERRKRRTIGRFGVTDTYKTGPQGLSPSDTIKGTKTLLGG